MTLVVEVQQAVDDVDLPPSDQVGDWARAAWRGLPEDAEVVVRITDEAESRRLNHRYRDRDRPTNVLSFPYEPLPELDLLHVGDLVICAPVVRREAVEQGKAVQAHWAHMVVHGMLHLQGYDHDTDDEAGAMEALETEILTRLGFPAPYDEQAS
jgi:probable rRNA maturation factor